MAPVAVIDVGTNSIKMVVAERAGSKSITILHKARETTRLGEGLTASGLIAPAAKERSIAALKSLAEQARQYGVLRITAIGTACLRDAGNGDEFLLRAREETGLAVEIITGEREAHLAYSAVRLDSTLPIDKRCRLLVFDIGGGSTELVCGERDEATCYESFAMGAVSFTERFLHTDPPTEAEYDQANRQAVNFIDRFPDCRENSLVVAGVGGTVVNAASVAFDGAGDVHGCEVARSQIQEVALRLRSFPIDARRRIPGLEPARADIILGGLAILEAILGSFSVEHFVVSARGIRYGLLEEMLRET